VTPGPPALTGVVLAGGASRRMGRDKALLEFGGEPLAARIARRLSAICQEVLIASGDGHRLARLGYREVADAREGCGPLAGIVAGLEAARSPLAAVVAVDMPAADPAVFLALAARWDGAAPAVVAQVAGRVEPLHGIYARSATAALRSRLASGQRSVHRVLAELRATVVDAAEFGGAAFAGNLNRPADLPAGPAR
jgi:molybdopterin-guanine dinucleotide biosynthesis protein A